MASSHSDIKQWFVTNKLKGSLIIVAAFLASMILGMIGYFMSRLGG